MVREAKESLADYVRRVRGEKRLSLKAVQRRSRNRISSGYISQIENGQVFNLTTEKLSALALGLGISEEELFRRSKTLGKPTEQDAKFAELSLKFREVSIKNQTKAETAFEQFERYLESLRE